MEETFVDGLRETKEHRQTQYMLRSYLGVLATAVKESCKPSTRKGKRHFGRGNNPTRGKPLASTLQDTKFALRALRRQPTFAAVAVVTIALGVGANTAIFSVVNGVLLDRLPFSDPGSLVVVWSHGVDSPEGRGSMSRENIEDIADLPSFSSLVGYTSTSATLTGAGEPEVVRVTRVSEGLLETFGLRPLLGRDLRRDENSPDAAQTVMISHSFWREHFGGNPDIVGTSIELSESPWEIVGVAPEGFSFDDGSVFWRSMRQDPQNCARGCSFFRTIGRLAVGATVESATSELDTIGETLAAEYPESNSDVRFRGLRLRDEMVGDFRGGLLVVFGTVGVVLLIACANVAILLLIRASAREGEMAVRSALGAGRMRILRQMLIESHVLSFAGAAVGLLLAWGALLLVKNLSAGTIPRIEAVHLDTAVFSYTIGTTVCVAFLFGLAPALSLARSGIATGLIAGGRSGAAGHRQGGFRSVLLALEVAMSLVLLVGCGLLLKTFKRMYEIDLGYRTNEIVRFTLSLPNVRYENLEQIVAFYSELEREIATVPGVSAVGSACGAPLSSTSSISARVIVDGRPEARPGDELYASIKSVTPGYLETMGIALLRGREIEAADGIDNIPVALVNESLVRENFPNEDPIGQRVRMTGWYGYTYPLFTIVGVVRDIRSRRLTRSADPEIYVPHSQFGPEFMTVTVRGAADAPNLLPAIRERVRSLDSNLPLRAVETMTEAVERQVATTRFYLVLIAVFSGLALSLAAVGLYGVAAYLAQTRERDIGIRMALGAGSGKILRLVMHQGMRPALVGIVVGIAASVIAARLIEGLLYGVAPRDPGVLAAVAGLLFLVALMATVLPALRATSVDPVEVMRAE